MSYEAWGEPEDDRFEAAREAGWIDPTDVSKATIDVMNERNRQWDEEGWTPEHDDTHKEGQLAMAASSYAWFAGIHDNARSHWNALGGFPGALWPWGPEHWKPTDRRRDLVKAAALILAEIERLDRAALKPEAGQ